MSDDSRTIWCGNLSEKVTEQLLYELFLQAAPLERVRIPVDKDGRKSNFAFITVKHEISVDYTLQLLNGTTLYGRPLNLRARSSTRNDQSPEIRIPSLFEQQLMFQQLNGFARTEPSIQINHHNRRHLDDYNRFDRRRDDDRHNRNNQKHRKHERRLRFY